MAEPINIQTFGGARVNMNEVESTEVVKDTNGKPKFIINFKSGVKVQYPKQSSSNQATVKSCRIPNELPNNRDLVKTEVNRFFGLELTGTDKFDSVEIEGSKNCRIDTCNDNTADMVRINDDYDTGKTFKSSNNIVIGNWLQVDERNGKYYAQTEEKYEVHREGDRPEHLN